MEIKIFKFNEKEDSLGMDISVFSIDLLMLAVPWNFSIYYDISAGAM